MRESTITEPSAVAPDASVSLIPVILQRPGTFGESSYCLCFSRRLSTSAICARLSEIDSGIRRYRARFCNRVAEDARSDGPSFSAAANAPPNADAVSLILGLTRPCRAAQQPQKTESLRQVREKLCDHLRRKVSRLRQHRRSIYSDCYRKRSRHS